MYIVFAISISDRSSTQCQGKDVSSQWAFPILQFPVGMTWAHIEKFLFGISSCSQKVLGRKDEINLRFAIPLDAPNDSTTS